MVRPSLPKRKSRETVVAPAAQSQAAPASEPAPRPTLFVSQERIDAIAEDHQQSGVEGERDQDGDDTDDHGAQADQQLLHVGGTQSPAERFHRIRWQAVGHVGSRTARTPGGRGGRL